MIYVWLTVVMYKPRYFIRVCYRIHQKHDAKPVEDDEETVEDAPVKPGFVVSYFIPRLNQPLYTTKQSECAKSEFSHACKGSCVAVHAFVALCKSAI